MAVKKFVVGCFDDDELLLPAVKRVRTSGYKIHDVYTPMPIHGLDRAIGFRETSIHTAGFIYGLTGAATTLFSIGWIFLQDWPLNLGGKPHFSLVAWIPITFELTVLFACVGMVLTFCYLCQLAPFVKKHRFHLRATDDLFVVVLECMPKTNEAEAVAFLKGIGAVETGIQVAEERWWWGTYDKEYKPYHAENETFTV